MEKKLTVNDLKISFRTSNGKVQAVRGISFDLYKGETLAIVGESGSGKSVTSKAILGILANNSIIEGGEIIYDGKDLLNIEEDDFHKIRGDKIAMIFQDPMSSLNPIMRIGKQLTEAMILKNKSNRRNSRNEFNTYLKNLLIAINEATDPLTHKENEQKIKMFDKFEYKQIELEEAYNDAFESANQAIDEIKNMLFEIEKNAVSEPVYQIKQIKNLGKKSINRFVVRNEAIINLLESSVSEIKLAKKENNYSNIKNNLEKALEILETAVKEEKPNFFRLGYYLTFIEQTIPEISVKEMNELTKEIINKNFMKDFLALIEKGLEHNYHKSIEAKKEALEVLNKYLDIFSKDLVDHSAIFAAKKEMINAVENSINKLDYYKISLAYTFKSSINNTLRRYYKGLTNNAKEEIRFEKDTKKWNEIINKGKTPGWSIIPKDIIDLEDSKYEIVKVITNTINQFKDDISKSTSYEATKLSRGVIEYLTEKASNVVYKVNKQVAKAKALKIMEEVGIPDVRRRFKQYPFQFSGGMRQRIVIAIALAANPDILICDEPTTALDVTIQAQILELINNLKKKRNLSVIFITHDLGVVANMADNIAVMYAGKIVELGSVNDIFYAPAHPYTWALLSSMPDLDTYQELEAIPGTPPNMIYPPKGDAFADRNKYALKIDFELEPPLFKISDTHYAATWLLHPEAPKVNPPKIVTDRILRMKKLGEENEQ